MRNTILILLISALQVFASGSYAQTTTISLAMDDATIREVLFAIQNQSEFYFLYNSELIDVAKKVNITSEEEKVDEILTRLFNTNEVDFLIKDRYIVLTPVGGNMEFITEQQQQPAISGTITDESGQPLPGVTVVVKGTTKGTVTNADGKYSLANIPEDATLVFSFVGMLTQENEVGNQSTIDVTMMIDAIGIEEVVAIGYGTMKKSDLTGAVTAIGEGEYKEQPVNRIDQILQGRTAGVNVVNSSGAPGGTASIRIRGANSINGNNDPLYVVDGFVGSDFRDVNPTDIESIQVLKDASSTAIYGSRGANGVVLITTKGGEVGKPKFSLTSRYFSSKILDTWDLMDAATFARVANERAVALGTTPHFTDADISNFEQNGGTDWQDELLRTGNGQEYQLDYSGGNGGVSYFISGNYLDQEGILINSDYKRYSLRTNINADINDKLKATLKMNFARRENNNTQGDANTAGPLAGALAWAPTVPVETIQDPISSVKGNPVESALNDNIQENNSFNANGDFIYEPIDGLTMNVGFGIRYGNTQQKAFSASRSSSNPSATRGSTERIFLQNTNTLTYNKTFNNIHSFTATGVVEHQWLQDDYFFATAVGLQFPDLKYDNITLAESISGGASKTKETIRSYIGRLNYNLMDKYLVTVSVRTDGSSKFRGDNRYSTFPSVGLGWRLSEEPAIKDMAFFDNLKLRASWGKTGSQAIPVYGTVTSFNTSIRDAGASFQSGSIIPGIIIGNPGNTGLKWETTEQVNVGLDIGVFKNRLSAEIDYFEKNTTDLLLSEPLPAYSGGGSIFRNLGEVKNNGFEFSLRGDILRNSRGLNWSMNFNASFLKNEVISIGDREQIFVNGNAGAGMTNLPEGVIMPGYSLSNYWGLKYLGVWQESEAAEAAKFGLVPGDSRFEDLNGDYVIGGDDYQIIGSGIPTKIFGWNNTFDYKAFTLNIFFQSLMGFDKWNFTYGQAVLAAADAREITHSDILNRWSPDNADSDIPAFSQTDIPEIQTSRFVERGDYLRLKNISLSYNLPRDFIKGINGSVNLSGNNLWTLTNYRGIDPESYSNRGIGDASGADAGSYPNAKTWTIGINLTF